MWPEMNFKKGFNIFQEIGPNYLGGQMENAARVAIHMSHRIGAIITTVFILFLFVKILALESPQATRLGFVLVAVLLTQIALGLGNIIFHFPLSVAVLHNGVGALLLLTLVALNQRIKTAILSNTHGEA
jgi:cytochrome c oxidase assembly protein subunit 15